MNYYFTSIIRLSFVLLTILLVTACPSPGKVKKAIQLNTAINLNNKFKKLFDESVYNRNTELVFHSVVQEKIGITIYLDLKSVVCHWDEDIVNFQKKLKQTNTDYQAILINDNRGPGFLYEPSYLKVYDSSLNLFWKNLEQIKENRIEDLYHTMKKTKVEYAALKELFDFIKVQDFDHYKLEFYPANDAYDYQPIIFCLKASKTDKLYFSYLREGSEVVLHSVDLNNCNSTIIF